MLPGDRIVVALVEPHEPTETFTDWLPHITIVPWFRNQVPSQQLSRSLEQALSNLKPFTIKIGKTDHFGRSRKLVNIVEPSTLLADIERSVRQVLKGKDSWIVDETTRQHRDFRPHITVQKSSKAKADDSFSCDKLYIISQQGNHKRIESIVKL